MRLETPGICRYITFGQHKASRRWTGHSPDGITSNQIDYIIVQRRFQFGVKIVKTHSFPDDIGSDHEVVMTLQLHLKKVSKQGHIRIKFDFEKLKDPDVAEAFHAKIGGVLLHSPYLVEDQHGHIDRHLQHSSN